MSKTIRIATRGSKLALWQANYVADLLKNQGHQPEIKIIKTEGDRVQDRFLHEMGGKGVFVRELEHRLHEKDADIAVHSLKDLPAKTPKPFTLAAIMKRHRAHDILVVKPESEGKLPIEKSKIGIEDLKSCGKFEIATASLRRQSLLKQCGSDIKLHPVRGNVDTRLRKLVEGDWDGLILAGASLERLEITEYHTKILDPDWFIPCAAQGALAIETLEDSPAREAVGFLNCPVTNACATMERKILEKLGGDCTMPFGAYIFPTDKGTTAHATVLNYDGKEATVTQHSEQKVEEIDQEAFVNSILTELAKKGVKEILSDLDLKTPDLGSL